MKHQLEQYKQDIIQMYKDGNSTVKIAAKYNCNTGTIWHHLMNWGVKVRKIQKFKGNIEDYKDKIVKLFNEDKSVYKISKELNIAKSTILRWLQRNGYNTNKKYKGNLQHMLKDHITEVVDLYNSGMTEDQIAKKLGFSGSNIHRVLKDTELEVRDYRYHVNEHFFDLVNSEEVAYVLGWFYSDGCVDNNGKLRIQIQKEDESILYIIKDLMEYEGPLYEVPPPKKYPHRKPQVSLTINRKVLADQLIALGCPPKKSLTLTFPSSHIISDQLMPHFIRGVFDGDGSISIKNNKYLNVSITSSEPFLQPFREWLINHLAIKTKHYYRYSHTNTIQMMITTTSYAKKFLDWMYRDANYYLARKFSKYQEYLKKGV